MPLIYILLNRDCKTSYYVTNTIINCWRYISTSYIGKVYSSIVRSAQHINSSTQGMHQQFHSGNASIVSIRECINSSTQGMHQQFHSGNASIVPLRDCINSSTQGMHQQFHSGNASIVPLRGCINSSTQGTLQQFHSRCSELKMAPTANRRWRQIIL